MSASRVRPVLASQVTLTLDGQPLPAREGEPLAASLLGAGVEVIARSPKYHRPRGAPCGRGHCHHCLVRVDGLPNRRACLTPVHEGMRVERQNTLGSAERDLLSATDWLFPRGLDHHAMFTGVPLVQPMVQKIVRKLSGLGRLPDEVPGEVSRGADLDASDPRGFDLLVVGGGNAGLAAARAGATAGARTLVVEARAHPGGRALSPLHRMAPPASLPGVTLWTEASAEWISRPGHVLEVVVRHQGRLHRLRPGAIVLACGTIVRLASFANNDLPGLFDARWAAELVRTHGVLPGREVIVAAVDAVVERLVAILEGAGARVVRTLPAEAAGGDAGSQPRILGAHGHRWVEGVTLATGAGEERLRCDALIHGLPGTPALELAATAGVEVVFDPAAGCFLPRVGAAGESTRPGVYLAGSITGRMPCAEAAEAGDRAGRAAATFALTRHEERRPDARS